MKTKLTAITLATVLSVGGVGAALAQGTSPTTGVPTVAVPTIAVATAQPRATTATTGTTGTTGSTSGASTTQNQNRNEGNGMSWGWLGLLGLGGLAPLFMKRRTEVEHTTVTREPGEPPVRRVS